MYGAPSTLSRIGQIALSVRDVDSAEAFYRDVLQLRWLYRFGDMTFFDCSGLRLLLEKVKEPGEPTHASPIYFKCTDIARAVSELEQRGVTFTSKPHLIAPMEDHDPDGILLRPGRPYSRAHARGTKGLRTNVCLTGPRP
jgi:methylmalonyl-CoA/ethylmalonyl-CoA epimerase